MGSRVFFIPTFIILNCNISCKSDSERPSKKTLENIDTGDDEQCTQEVLVQNEEGIIDQREVLFFGETPARGPYLQMDFEVKYPDLYTAQGKTQHHHDSYLNLFVLGH